MVNNDETAEEVGTEQESQKEKGNKVEKRFTALLTKVVTLMKGEDNLKLPKVEGKAAFNLVDELLKESREEVYKNFKEKGKALITKKVEFDRFVKLKEKEMKEAIIKKKEEMNKEMEGLLNLLENQHVVERDYNELLNAASATASAS